MKRLTKSHNKIFDGVLGGVGNYFGVDPVWLRLAYLLFAFMVDFGTAIIVYLVAMFVIPREGSVYQSPGDKINADINEIKNSVSNQKAFTIIGVVLILLGIVFLMEQLADIHIWRTFRFYYYEVKKYLWPVLLILLGVWILFKRKK